MDSWKRTLINTLHLCRKWLTTLLCVDGDRSGEDIDPLRKGKTFIRGGPSANGCTLLYRSIASATQICERDSLSCGPLVKCYAFARPSGDNKFPHWYVDLDEPSGRRQLRRIIDERAR